jgi:hypothetical protein
VADEKSDIGFTVEVHFRGDEENIRSEELALIEANLSELLKMVLASMDVED